MIVLQILLLVGLFFLPGLALWIAFGQSLKKHVHLVEALFLILVGGFAITGWVALLLAEASLFSLAHLAIVIFGVSLILIGWAVSSGRLQRPFERILIVPASFSVLAILILAIVIIPEPFEYIVGGRDHGVYINTGVHIARQGSIIIHDDILPSLPKESYPNLTMNGVSVYQAGMPGPWSEGQRVSGLTIRDANAGIFTPHAFHLYPAFIAIFFSTGGIYFALATTMIFGLLGTLSIYVASARIFGQRVALLATFLLTISLTQIWFTRYPSAEIVVQFFFWSGLFALMLMLETRNRFAAVLAAFCMGMVHLAKLDTVLIPVALAIFFLYLWFRNQFDKSCWYFVVVYGLLLVHFAYHAFFFSTIYFIDHMVRNLLPKIIGDALAYAGSGYPYPLDIIRRLIGQNIEYIIPGGLFFILALVLTNRWGRTIGNFLEWAARYGRVWQVILLLTLFLLTFRSNNIQQQQYEAYEYRAAPVLTSLDWYITPFTLLLGASGVVLFALSKPITHGNGDDEMIPDSPVQFIKHKIFDNRFLGWVYQGNHLEINYLVWWLLLANIVPLFVLGSGTAPDHFWAIRRFIPVVLPSVLIFACLAIFSLWSYQGQLWVKTIILITIMAFLAFGLWQKSRPLANVVEYDGFVEQVADLADHFTPADIILFSATDAANRVGLPLWFLFDRNMFINMGRLDSPALVTVVEFWLEQGKMVYWVTTDGGRPFSAPGLVPVYQATHSLIIPLAETPRDHIPQKAGHFLAALDIYQIKPSNSISKVPTVFTLNVTRNDYDNAGLFDIEAYSGLAPRRFTTGEVNIELPVTGHPEELILMLGNGRPTELSPPKVSVYFDNHFIDSVLVSDVVQTVIFPIPDSVEGNTIGHSLHLEAETWVPATLAPSPDGRELGVYLDWVRLVSTE